MAWPALFCLHMAVASASSSRDRSRSRMAATYSMKCMIGGFHIYQSVWSPITGEELPCVRELSNAADPFAVAVMKNFTVVGHIPRKIHVSSFCSMFL